MVQPVGACSEGYILRLSCRNWAEKQRTRGLKYSLNSVIRPGFTLPVCAEHGAVSCWRADRPAARRCQLVPARGAALPGKLMRTNRRWLWAWGCLRLGKRALVLLAARKAHNTGERANPHLPRAQRTLGPEETPLLLCSVT